MFVSDIHIKDSNDKCIQQLKDLVDRIKPSTIIFLGDIFDGWIGWDADPELSIIWKHWIASLPRDCKIFFISGNRDQLLQAPEDLSPIVCLPDPCIVNIGTHRWLLTHGDRYCSEDHLHLLWIKMQQYLSSPFLQLPLAFRRRIRAFFFKQSSKHKQSLSLEKQQIPERQLHDLQKKHKLHMIVHGHTHRPKVQMKGTTKWVTLGDWGTTPSYLYVEKPQRWTLCFTPNF